MFAVFEPYVGDVTHLTSQAGHLRTDPQFLTEEPKRVAEIAAPSEEAARECDTTAVPCPKCLPGLPVPRQGRSVAVPPSEENVGDEREPVKVRQHSQAACGWGTFEMRIHITVARADYGRSQGQRIGSAFKFTNKQFDRLGRCEQVRVGENDVTMMFRLLENPCDGGEITGIVGVVDDLHITRVDSGTELDPRQIGVALSITYNNNLDVTKLLRRQGLNKSGSIRHSAVGHDDPRQDGHLLGQRLARSRDIGL